LHLFADSAPAVREEAASVAAHLRDCELGPFAETLVALIESDAFAAATPQLLITLRSAPDRVHDLTLRAARRFLSEFEEQISDLSTSAAGDGRYVGELVMRAFAQARNSTERREALDLIDALLLAQTYGMGELLESAERTT
jgi:hypothetical protein